MWGRRGTNHWALKTGKQVRGRRPLKTGRSNLHAFNAQNVAGAADIRPMALCIIVGAESKPPSHPVCVWTGIHNCLTIGGGSWFSSGVSLCLSIYFVKGVSLQGLYLVCMNLHLYLVPFLKDNHASALGLFGVRLNHNEQNDHNDDETPSNHVVFYG